MEIEPGRAYTVRWIGEVEAPETALYGFRVQGAGRVTIDGRALRDGEQLHLRGGQRYPIQVEATSAGVHPSAAHGATLMWRIGQAGAWDEQGAWRVVPQARLYAPSTPSTRRRQRSD